MAARRSHCIAEAGCQQVKFATRKKAGSYARCGSSCLVPIHSASRGRGRIHVLRHEGPGDGRHRQPHRPDLELSDANRLQLFEAKSTANERQLRGFFTDYDWWPADAQLALMAMGWGLGAAFPSRWPKFSSACKKKKFDAAAVSSGSASHYAFAEIANPTWAPGLTGQLNEPHDQTLGHPKPRVLQLSPLPQVSPRRIPCGGRRI